MVRDTLELPDDEDTADIRKAVERCFGVQLADQDAEACHTVGDLADLLCRHLDNRGAGGCATAMAFYRLRRGLAALDAREPVRPGSNLAGAAPGLSARRLLAGLEQATGLRFPARGNGWVGRAGTALLLAALALPVWWVAGQVRPGGWPGWCTPPALVLAGLALLRWRPGRLPSGCATAGEMARRVAALNFGALHAAGARARPRDVLAALAQVLADHLCLDPAGIGRDTRFLRGTHAA